MKKQILLILILLPNILLANLSNSVFYSQHPSSFNKHSIALYNNKFYVTGAEVDLLNRENNFRVFIPNFTRSVYIRTLRICSCGWFTYAVSLGQIPSVYSQDTGTLKSEYQGQYQITSSGSDYESIFPSVDLTTYADKLVNGKTLATINEIQSFNKTIYFDTPEKRKSLNKWLYIATDTRPSPANPNPLSATKLSISFDIIKSEVDAKIDTLP